MYWRAAGPTTHIGRLYWRAAGPTTPQQISCVQMLTLTLCSKYDVAIRQAEEEEITLPTLLETLELPATILAGLHACGPGFCGFLLSNQTQPTGTRCRVPVYRCGGSPLNGAIEPCGVWTP